MASRVRIIDVTGSSLAISTEKAHNVCRLIGEHLNRGGSVELSFEGVDTTITAFLNTAVGQLYGKYAEEDLQDRLQVVDTTPEIDAMLSRTVENAKRFFKEPEAYKRAYSELERVDAG